MEEAIKILKSDTSRKEKIQAYKDIIYLTVPAYVNSEDSYINRLRKNHEDCQLYKFYYDMDNYKLLLKLSDYDFIEHLCPTGSTEWQDSISKIMKGIKGFKDASQRIFNETVDEMIEWLEDEYYNGKNILNYYNYAHQLPESEWVGEGFFIEPS